MIVITIYIRNTSAIDRRLDSTFNLFLLFFSIKCIDAFVNTLLYRFGAVPARPAAGRVVQTGHDFSQRDRIVPHPVYRWMCWIAIVNPTRETFEKVKPLLSGAYERAVERYRSRMGRPSSKAAYVRPSPFG